MTTQMLNVPQYHHRCPALLSLVGYIVMREEVLQTDIRFDLHFIDIPDMAPGITGAYAAFHFCCVVND